MAHYLNSIAVVLALGAAIVATLIGTWQEMPLPGLVLRCAVSAAVVYGFARFAGEMGSRAVLRGLAEHAVDQEQASADGHPSAGGPAEKKAA